MKRNKEETERLRKKAFGLYSKEIPARKIAELIGVSERMVYRYIDAEKLLKAENELDIIRRAVGLLDADTKRKFRIALRKAQ